MFILTWTCTLDKNASFLTVIKLQHLVVDRRGHADGLSGEVWVVVESLSHGHSRWRFAVSC